MLDKVKYIVFLPIRFNDGRGVPKRLHLECDDELFGCFGGLTVAGYVSGFWISNGRRYQDEHRQVFVVADETEAHDRFMREFKLRAMDRFEQEELWIERHQFQLV